MRERFRSREHARMRIFWYIECFYNARRRHSSLGYKTRSSTNRPPPRGHRGLEPRCQRKRVNSNYLHVAGRDPLGHWGPTATFAIFNLNGSGGASDEIGPGSVDLLSGDLSLSATDVSIPGPGGTLEISRSYHSRQTAMPGAAAAVLGSGWTLEVADDDSSSDYARLKPQDPLLTVVTTTGEPLTFTKTATNLYTALGTDWASLQVTHSTAPTPENYKVIDTTTGDSVTFLLTNGEWLPSTIKSLVATSATHYSTIAPTIGLADRMATWPTSVAYTAAQCLADAPPTGCRQLRLVYTTIAAGQRLARVEYWAAATSGGAVVKADDVAQYSYDASGRLATASDPRTPSNTETFTYYTTAETGGPDRLLKTYKPDGGTTTPPYTLAYANVPAYDGAGTALVGRLVTSTRDAFENGSSTGTPTRETIVWSVAVSGAGAPWNLSAAAAATWGQGDGTTYNAATAAANPQAPMRELPISAVAVFPPQKTSPAEPDLPTIGAGGLPTATNYTRATVHYLDDQVREVNTASPAPASATQGYIDTTEYDQTTGNERRTLSAGNRLRVLAGASSNLLDEQTRYSSDGLDEIETLGPAHQVKIGASTVTARTRTLTTYLVDSLHPHLVAQTDTGACAAPCTSVTGSNSWNGTTTRTNFSYSADGLAFRTPTTATVDQGGLALTTLTQIDHTTGAVTATRQPKGTTSSPVGDPYWSTTTYYQASSSDPDCQSTTWADLACKTAPGGMTATAGLAELPNRWVRTYDDYLNPIYVSESVNSTAGTILSTRYTYTCMDAAERPVRLQTLTDAAGSAGVDLPIAETTYDANTGNTLHTRAVSGTALLVSGTNPPVVPNPSGCTAAATVDSSIQRAYDPLGRTSSYTDANGQATTTTYDARGRTLTVNDGKGTTSVAYDETAEPRGLPTSLTDTGVSGTWTATYDADGAVTDQDLPGPTRQCMTYDEAGRLMRQRYVEGTCASPTSTWQDEQILETPQSQWATRTATLGNGLGTAGTHTSNQAYTYDGASRLVQVDDTYDGICTRRSYTLDSDTNRTNLTERIGTGATCPSTGGTSMSYSYDASDRLTTSAFTYDNWGRITTAPSTHTGAAGAAIYATYYANDLVRSLQTGNGVIRTSTLDPNGRPTTWTDSNGSTTARTYHYGSDLDSPSWNTENAAGTAFTRPVEDLAGNLSILDVGANGDLLQLTDVHGDVIGSAGLSSSGPDAIFETTEFGVPRAGLPSRYQWLGAKGRQSDSSGAILLGVRVYLPTIGRFLQIDPVFGGSANRYDYCSGDPVNCYDLDGRAGLPRLILKVAAKAGKKGYRILGRLIRHARAKRMDYHHYKGDLYHRLPRSIVSDVIRHGQRTVDKRGRISYRLKGSINGVDGVFEAAGRWRWIGRSKRFVVHHALFKPHRISKGD